MALSCSQKLINNIKTNNIKKWWFLLLESSSFLFEQKTNWIAEKNMWVKRFYYAFKDTKILELCQYQKNDKAPFIIYSDLDFQWKRFRCLIEKIDACKSDPQNSFTTKVGKHIQSDFSMSTVLSS